MNPPTTMTTTTQTLSCTVNGSPVSVDLTDDGLTLLRAAKTTLSMLDRVEASIEASEETLQQAQEARAAAQKEYEDECRKRGVCEDCPWK